MQYVKYGWGDIADTMKPSATTMLPPKTTHPSRSGLPISGLALAAERHARDSDRRQPRHRLLLSTVWIVSYSIFLVVGLMARYSAQAVSWATLNHAR